MIKTIIFTAVIFLLTIITAVNNVKIKIKNIKFSVYYIVALLGAILLILFRFVDFKYVISSLTNKSSVNPLKILALFFSMTMISIFLDEVGFFTYLVSRCVKKSGNNQIKLFTELYFLVAILTIFTSNDIIILTFTPFICIFCKHLNVSPIPYLFGEFVSANTFSLTLIIGNPTNIYLCSYMNIDFFEYFKIMVIPSIVTGIVAYGIILLIFKKTLKKQVTAETFEIKVADKFALTIALSILCLTIILLSISNFLGLEMYLICLVFAGVLIILALINAVRKNYYSPLIRTFVRIPWGLAPFMVSMFVCTLTLDNSGITKIIAEFLNSKSTVFSYGISSFLMANIMNNIPMSVFYSNIISFSGESTLLKATLSTVAGSNIGAYLSPIGALAGIMWSNLIEKSNVKFRTIDFIKYGALISIPCILVCLFTINIIL